MKRLVLVLGILFPIGLAAQAGNPSPVKYRRATVAAAQAMVSTAGDEAASVQTDSSADAAFDPDPNAPQQPNAKASQSRSEEHTSELQSLRHLVCRLLLEK